VRSVSYWTEATRIGSSTFGGGNSSGGGIGLMVSLLF